MPDWIQVDCFCKQLFGWIWPINPYVDMLFLDQHRIPSLVGNNWYQQCQTIKNEIIFLKMEWNTQGGKWCKKSDICVKKYHFDSKNLFAYFFTISLTYLLFSIEYIMIVRTNSYCSISLTTKVKSFYIHICHIISPTSKNHGTILFSPGPVIKIDITMTLKIWKF